MNKYNIGDIAMFKKNLLLVKIIKTNKKNEYCVYYPHLENPHNFWVKEEELEEKPFNYNEIIFKAYLEYRTKYYNLIDTLYSPSVKERLIEKGIKYEK